MILVTRPAKDGTALAVYTRDSNAETTAREARILSLAQEPMTASPFEGEPLPDYAQRVAESAGLTVAEWEITGNDGEDTAQDGEGDLIH